MFYLTIVFTSLPCFISCAIISSLDTGNENSHHFPLVAAAAANDSRSNLWSTTTKYFGDCIDREYAEIVNCFGIKSVLAIDRAAQMSTINIVPGISFIADDEVLRPRTARNSRSEQEIKNSVSSEANKKGFKLVDLLFDSMIKFLENHTLQFRLPKSTSFELQRALDESRGKIKKRLVPFLGVVAVKVFVLLPLLLGAVGFLALKALIIGKIALITAGILAFQKYSHGGFAGMSKLIEAYSIWPAGSSYSPTITIESGDLHRRRIEDQATSQHLAYNAHTSQEIPTSP